MSRDISSIQRIYSPKEMAKLLGIADTTVRKYSQELEKEGYHIYKNEKGHRGYYDKDIILFKQIIEIAKHPDMSLEHAIKAVVSTQVSSGISVSDIQKATDKNYITKEDFKAYQERQEEYYQALLKQQKAQNRYLLEQLQKRDEYIISRLEQRDHDLMTAIRTTQETKKIIAATNQKQKWWKFWGN
ncbi:DUF3967 domain-containing protein [Bacillus sp. C30]|uniref:DUF3967 domain-containing protein n=1 Tax=Bacillus sp. C30 TaxID=1387733 RepID=UPI00349F12BB